jgi:D-alanyl-D-alanine endopeptidase (penicillin-binding protein 7)
MVLVVAVSVPLGAGAAASKSRAVKKKPAVVAKAASAKAVRGKTVSSRAAVKRSTSLVRKGKAVSVRSRARLVRAEPVRASFGQLSGLHSTDDPLDLKSSVALVLDQDTNEVLFSKNSQAVLPIASITKLMTAVVVTEAKLPLDEVLTVTQDDVDTEKGSSSRLSVGAQLTREEMLHLALMSSENRAANALGRHYPGGLHAFVAAMNQKAAELGMHDTRYVEPTGLSSRNQSSARDLATLVKHAHGHRIIRDLSTSLEYQVAVGHRQLQYRNTNGLVKNPEWEIGLQKTGYISEAGRCLVMQARLAGRQVIMVFLDSAGRYSRIGDAERVRKWINETLPLADQHSPSLPSLPGNPTLPAVPTASVMPKVTS